MFSFACFFEVVLKCFWCQNEAAWHVRSHLHIWCEPGRPPPPMVMVPYHMGGEEQWHMTWDHIYTQVSWSSCKKLKSKIRNLKFRIFGTPEHQTLQEKKIWNAKFRGLRNTGGTPLRYPTIKNATSEHQLGEWTKIQDFIFMDHRNTWTPNTEKENNPRSDF